MSAAVAALLLALSAAVGLLVGAVGIGGVVLVPIISLAFSVDLKVAIASCLLSYLFSGIVSVWLYRRYGSIEWRPAGWLAVGAVPGAFAGAAAVDLISAEALSLAISMLMLAAGAHALLGCRSTASVSRAIPPAAMLPLGLLVGFVSALTGTGGAVTLIPLLLALGFPPLPAIGLGQVMQLPVAISGSVRNLAAGLIDLRLAGLLAVGLGTGVCAGARLAHVLPTRTLRHVLAVLLILFGTGLAIRSSLP